MDAGQYITQGVDHAYLAALENSVRLAQRKRAGQAVSLLAEGAVPQDMSEESSLISHT